MRCTAVGACDYRRVRGVVVAVVVSEWSGRRLVGRAGHVVVLVVVFVAVSLVVSSRVIGR